MMNPKRERHAQSTIHFPAHAWVDYTRGLGSGEDRQEMADHLETGCDHCRLTVELFTLIGDVTRADLESRDDAVMKAGTALFARNYPLTRYRRVFRDSR